MIEEAHPSHRGRILRASAELSATRKHFLRADGTIDQEYLDLRVAPGQLLAAHCAGPLRRRLCASWTTSAAHTSHGADPQVYIPERYVIGMMGFTGQRIAGLCRSCTLDPGWRYAGLAAWHALLMSLIELLARPYGEGREPETFQSREATPRRRCACRRWRRMRRRWMARAIEYHDVSSWHG
ncbi:hypothetical protein [Candidatus Amarolinea aalborgensis]|uniref:hypothetical protein n=1 Tax=Candidatus Amarolinea aalborgensis TaxID=2249329 RepID=UPI003BF9BC57